MNFQLVYGPNTQGMLSVSALLLMAVRLAKIADSAAKVNTELKTDLDFLILDNIYRDGIPARGL